MDARSRWFSLFVLLLLAAPLLAQGKLTLEARFEPATAAPGAEVELVLAAKVSAGWHAYGTKETTNIPVGLKDKNLQATGLELVGAAVVPPGSRKSTFGVETWPLPNSFEVRQRFRVVAGFAGPEASVTGQLDYQLCDANMCLAPSKASFTAKLKVGAAAAAAQEPKAAPTMVTAADGNLRLGASVQPGVVRAGEQVTLVLEVVVDEKWHAYGIKETTNIPVELKDEKLQLGGFKSAGNAVVPPGERKEAFGVETFPLPHTFRVTKPLLVPADSKPGEVVIRGTLDYQLCDANSCAPPGDVEFEVKVTVEAGAARAAGGDAPAKATPQEPKGGAKVRAPDGKLSLGASVQPSPARPGESVTLVLEVVVDDKWHAYGTKETTNIPVELKDEKLQLGGLKSAGDAVVPPGERKESFGVETFPLPHTFRVTKPLLVPADSKAGEVVIRGTFDYQLCDANSCDPPGEVEFEVKVTIEAGDARAAAPADPIGGSWWQLILACIGGGLFALVMPCTYPMIPITFSFFTKQADARGGKVLTLALTYGLGIIGMFALIGALAGVIGERIVPFAAHWITNVVIGGAFLVFALSLLGLFTLQPPRFLVDVAGKSRGAGGLTGVLLMGATLVISSFTCTAPVVALLLLPAVQSGDSLRPTVGMAVFGLTMALPFVLLALLPGRVRSLPRSGEWMNTLKVSLGFIELAAALKFFSNAEYVLQLHWMPTEVFFGAWTLIFTVLAVYLWGLVPRAAIGNGRRVGGLLSLVFAAYCVYGALGYKLDFVMNALAPAYSLAEIPGKDGHEKPAAYHELEVDDYEAAVAQAKAQGKLVLVNLTGFTCSNCRMVEKGILPDPVIRPILEQHFVEARLHMDNEAAIPAGKWKRHLQLRQDLVEGRTTTPTYVSVDPNTGKAIIEHVLSGGPNAWLASYRQFLESSLQKTGRPLPAAK
jgi:thiol:disulfide interchange protein DsbD